MSYYTVSPPVCGEFGPGTEVDHTTRPKTYNSVTFMVDGWPEDLTTSHPVYMVSERLGHSLSASKCTGFALGPCRVEKADTFRGSAAEVRAALPKFHRLFVTGYAGVDDFGFEATDLVVSEKVKDILSRFYTIGSLIDTHHHPRLSYDLKVKAFLEHQRKLEGGEMGQWEMGERK